MLLYLVLVAVLGLYVLIAVDKQSQKVGCCLSVKKLGGQAHNYKMLCNVLAFAILFIFWFLTAFRSETIGNDTKNYIIYFDKIIKTGISSEYRIEYGLQILCVIVGFFSKDPQVFLAVCATICYLGVGIYIYKYSKNILVSTILVFCFCFSIFVNTLRQDIAMVICLYAYQALKKDKKFGAFLLILFAFLFHKSAIVFLPMLIYKWLRFNFKSVIIIAFLIIILSISGIMEPIVHLISSQYSGYFSSKYADSGWLAVALEVVRNFILYLFIWRAYKKDRKNHCLVLASFTFLLLCSCFGFIVNMFTRLAQYFLLTAIVEIPNACYEGQVKKVNVWIALICGVLLIYFIVILVFRPEWNNLYPYYFFWF